MLILQQPIKNIVFLTYNRVIKCIGENYKKHDQTFINYHCYLQKENMKLQNRLKLEEKYNYNWDCFVFQHTFPSAQVKRNYLIIKCEWTSCEKDPEQLKRSWKWGILRKCLALALEKWAKSTIKFSKKVLHSLIL